MLAPVVGPRGVERAGLIQGRKEFIRQRRHGLVRLFGDAHRKLGQSAWIYRVDQPSRGVVGPVDVLRLVLERRQRRASPERGRALEVPAVPARSLVQAARRTTMPG